MPKDNKRSPYASPFLMVVLLVNGFLFCLGALGDHSKGIIILYCILALLNFLGSWKIGYDWKRYRQAVNRKETQEISELQD